MTIYNSSFYKDKELLVINSAKQIVPWLILHSSIKSVVDVGCGNGLWLSVFLENGIKDIIGYDGDWVDRSLLAIPDDKFVSLDLVHDNFNLTKADLAISLEVAEHLPENMSDRFVTGLTQVSSLVMFSAAIPGQGGTNHINEQWPDYWIKKFEKNGFTVIDALRKNFWNNNEVVSWYKQNTFIFIKNDELINYPNLVKEGSFSLSYNIVHPEMFLGKISELSSPENYSLKKLVKKLPEILWKKLLFKLRRH